MQRLAILSVLLAATAQAFGAAPCCIRWGPEGCDCSKVAVEKPGCKCCKDRKKDAKPAPKPACCTSGKAHGTVPPAATDTPPPAIEVAYGLDPFPALRTSQVAIRPFGLPAPPGAVFLSLRI